ncbi:MAG: DUF6468 domain-containing protein [Alphaproteobacteria bacterium]|nr:DUF6468 domain-containing protein [Alphaproteobacteria bacterium]
MTAWIGIILDVILICAVGAGIVQAVRLIRQLRDLRASRADMDRFVRDFNGAVMRAEAGIKGLRAAARESGDDLEKLVEKALLIRDELNFIVESADGVAERLSVAATGVMRNERSSAPKAEEPKPAAAPSGSASASTPPPAAKTDAPPTSRAEKELMQALKKLN